ncbi:MAG: AAA family ATPase [Hyphomicrobiales bacterium]
MVLDGDHIQITRRGQTSSVSLQALLGPPHIEKRVLGTSLSIYLDGRPHVSLKGSHYEDALAFSREVREAWIQFNVRALARASSHLEAIVASIRALAAPLEYPAACKVAPLLEKARALDASILSKIRPQAIDAVASARVATVRSFSADPQTVRAAGIAAFVAAELGRWNDFFDTFEAKPLTFEQRLSVVVDEDATLVLAAAGSGKTSVITAKAAYLAMSGIRKPEEILLLAFAKNAASEMSERVKARSGIPIVARTFHAIAYEIIGDVEGSKPALRSCDRRTGLHQSDQADPQRPRLYAVRGVDRYSPVVLTLSDRAENRMGLQDQTRILFPHGKP